MATRTVFPPLTQGDYDLGVRAMQTCLTRALRHRNSLTGYTRRPLNAENGAYGQGTVKDLVVFKQYHNLLDTRGKINPHVVGKPAWDVLWRYATAVENGWVVTRLRQIKEAQEAAKRAASKAGLRDALVGVSDRFLRIRLEFLYAQIRPFPLDIFDPRWRRRYDCSSTVIALYWCARVLTDPSGFGYQGWGDTGALWRHGVRTYAPLPGDLAFYGWESRNARPQHVAMHLGGGEIVTFGSTPPRRTTVNYRTDYIGSRSYL